MTSKLQVTIPKVIAEQYRIRPGDEIDWVPAGPVIRIVPPGVRVPRLSVEERLRMFDEDTRRIQGLFRGKVPRTSPRNRGWSREDLYQDRGRPR